MKRVCFLTNYYDYLKSFSPLILTEEQIKMFLKAGYKPVAIVTEGFTPPDDSYFNKIELRMIHNVFRDDDKYKDKSFEDDVNMLAFEIEKHLKDVDVVITHDLLYMPDYTKYNLAARIVAKKNPKLKWLHWIHSCTPINLLSDMRQKFIDVFPSIVDKPFPNSLAVFPNTYDIPRVAKSLGFKEKDVRCVPHPIDYCKYNKFEKDTIKLVEDRNLLDADAICVYPLRLDRGKQPHIVLEIMAEVKNRGKSTRVIFIDLQSNSQDPNDDKFKYREELKQQAIDLGFNKDEVIFTSEFIPEWNLEVSRSVVADLMRLANVFILPSRSETFSLVALEAEIQGASIVLNQDFPPMRSIYHDMAHYRRFSSNIDITADIKDANGDTNTEYSDRKGYMSEIASTIIGDLNKNPLKGMTYFRKNNNMNVIFLNYIEPLLGEE